MAPRERDPEARRAAILVAAEQVIAELGIERATHRAIATRAAVPLGSTTYYFPTRRDLIAAALQRSSDVLQVELDRWAAELRGAADPAATLAGLLHAYLQDPEHARVDTELYVAAGRSPELVPLARRWMDGMAAVLAPVADAATAWTVSIFLDGVILQAVATGAVPEVRRLEDGLRRLLGAGSP